MSIDHRMMHRYLADQAGVLSVGQADLCGITTRMARRRVADGTWHRVLPGVVAPGGEPGPEGRVHAAVLWAGAGGTLCGETALWWWGLVDRFPETVAVVLPSHRRRSSFDYVRVQRHFVPDADRTTERRIRTVSKPYAVLFAGRHIGKAAQSLMDRALQRGFTLSDFEQVLGRNQGAEGVVAARRLLRSAADGTASESERVLASLLRGAGIGGWTANRRRRIGGRQILPDFTFEEARLVVEIDGWAFHSDPERFASDRARQNTLVLDGWTVLRFTWLQLTEQPEEVLRTIRSALARSALLYDR